MNGCLMGGMWKSALNALVSDLKVRRYKTIQNVLKAVREVARYVRS